MSGETGVEKDSVESKEEEGERERERGARGRQRGGGQGRGYEACKVAEGGKEGAARDRFDTDVCACVRACMCVCKEEWRIEAKGEIHRRWIGRGGHEAATRRASLARFHARNEDERRL